MREVTINQEPVELFKLLKFCGLANSGGEAKVLIESEQILVNGVVETRKRKKIVAGDVITREDESIIAVIDNCNH